MSKPVQRGISFHSTEALMPDGSMKVVAGSAAASADADGVLPDHGPAVLGQGIDPVPVVLPPFVRSPYNYDMFAASNETALHCPEPTLTQQSQLEEADINFIFAKFTRTGELPMGAIQPMYGDFSGITDYGSALRALKDADVAFMQLDAKVRARFDNEPARLLDFLADPSNRAEAVSLGLVVPTPTPEPKPAQTPEKSAS